MNTYLRILSYASPFGKIIPLYLLMTLLYIIFSMVNYSVLIPLLEVLFDQVRMDSIENIGKIKGFEFSIQYLKNIFYSYFNELIIQEGRKEALKFVCYIILASVILANIFKYFSAILVARVRVRVVTNLRKVLFEKIMTFKIKFFTDKKRGDIISRITSDIQLIENTVINSVTVLVKEPLLIIGIFLILSTISSKLTMYTLVLAPISGAIISYIAKHLKAKSASSQSALGRINNTINELLDGIRIIKLFTANNFMKSRFIKELNDYGKQNLSMYKRFELSNPITDSLGVATVALLLIIGGDMVLGNTSSISGSEFIAFIIIFSQVLKPAKTLTSAFNSAQRGLASADRVFEYIDKESIKEINNGKETIIKLKESIVFNNVDFGYENDKVLKKISFEIKKGEKIALVGPSGGGKSTIIDLLINFYKIQNGTIQIDGKNLYDYRTDDLRKLIGIVTQDSILFHDTIKNNITFGNHKFNELKMIQSSKVANALPFIDKLKDGFETIIGEKGLKLSGGQRQRICIARAIYKNPPILIFDEATSSLDSKSENSVQIAIEEVMKDRTSIIIAHRLSTIKNVDSIIVIDNGKIVEVGSHEKLLKSGKIYSKLLEMQKIK